MPSYSEKINKLFYFWLLASLILIFIMIIVGGFTRLTNSGLSITEWELFSGILPPLNKKDWYKYFLLYKEIPQYQLVNPTMSINEFKIIFYWEYFHRFLGRIIGLFFLLPLIYFSFTKKINKEYLYLCFFVLFLIFLQGFLGWYMVKSGLINNVTVSHYRLSLHLSLAFLIITIIFWILLNVKNETVKLFFSYNKYHFIFYFLIFMLFLQIILGAFVSGLDAGRIYQTWPLMNYSYFPNDVTINYISDYFDFDNHALVQFYHRNIAYLITIYVVFVGLFIFYKRIKRTFNSFYLVIFFLIFQIILGILTLITGLNIYLASAHQICSSLLILSVINLYYIYIN